MRCLFTLLLISCFGVSYTATAAGEPTVMRAGALKRELLLEATDEAALKQAQALIHMFHVPVSWTITKGKSGSLLLCCQCKTHFPQRYGQMLQQLEQLPGIRLLKKPYVCIKP